MRRRELLGGMAASVAAALCLRATRGSVRAQSGRAAAPRYWILIVPVGGIDAVWTTDPRTRREVKAGVDLPYPATQIVDAGDIRFGPHFSALAARAERLAVVNGVLVKAANHYTGVEQVVRLRTGTTMRTPAVFDVIGAHRDSQALAHVVLNAPLRQGRTSVSLGTAVDGDFGGDTDVLDLVDQLAPEELRELAALTGEQIQSFKRRGAGSDREQRMLDALGQARALFERAAELPRFSVGSGGRAGPDLARTLWLLENDLAACVTMFTDGFAWDTHYDNTARQSRLNPGLATTLVGLLDELGTRSNRHGKLADQTAVIVASEIGRFPYLNRAQGKDHLPQIPVMLSGNWFACGRTFGATGPELDARPVSLDRGIADDRGARMLLDDVGYTALRIAGLHPESFAVSARELRFVRAA